MALSASFFFKEYHRIDQANGVTYERNIIVFDSRMIISRLISVGDDEMLSSFVSRAMPRCASRAWWECLRLFPAQDIKLAVYGCRHLILGNLPPKHNPHLPSGPPPCSPSPLSAASSDTRNRRLREDLFFAFVINDLKRLYQLKSIRDEKVKTF